VSAERGLRLVLEPRAERADHDVLVVLAAFQGGDGGAVAAVRAVGELERAVAVEGQAPVGPELDVEPVVGRVPPEPVTGHARAVEAELVDVASIDAVVVNVDAAPGLEFLTVWASAALGHYWSSSSSSRRAITRAGPSPTAAQRLPCSSCERRQSPTCMDWSFAEPVSAVPAGAAVIGAW